MSSHQIVVRSSNVQESHKKKDVKKLWKSVGKTLSTITGASKLKNKKLINHVSQGNVKGVLEYLSAGFDMDSVTSNGFPLLYIACSRGHYQIVKLLIDNGARLDSHTPNGATSLYAACEQGRLMAVKLLVEYDTAFTTDSHDPANIIKHMCQTTGLHPLHIAARNGHTSVVHFLLQRNVPVNLVSSKESCEVSSLILASSEGHIDIQRCLLDGGADVMQTDNNGNSPLHFACQYGHYLAVHSLLGAGADPYFKNRQKQSSWDIANLRGHVEILSLMEETASRNEKAGDGLHANIRFEKNVAPKLQITLGNRHPSVINIIIRNRMRYAHFYELGVIREQDSDTDDNDPAVDSSSNIDEKKSSSSSPQQDSDQVAGITSPKSSSKQGTTKTIKTLQHKNVKQSTKLLKERERQEKLRQKEEKKIAKKLESLKQISSHLEAQSSSRGSVAGESHQTRDSQESKQDHNTLALTTSSAPQYSILSQRIGGANFPGLQDLLEIQAGLKNAKPDNTEAKKKSIAGTALAEAIAQATIFSRIGSSSSVAVPSAGDVSEFEF